MLGDKCLQDKCRGWLIYWGLSYFLLLVDCGAQVHSDRPCLPKEPCIVPAATWQRCWVLHPKASESCQASPSRASRRWRDLEREFRPLPHKLEEGDATIGTTNSAATTSGTPTVLQQHQGLPTLHESTSDDPEEWLGQLEFIRTFNHQDDKEAFSTWRTRLHLVIEPLMPGLYSPEEFLKIFTTVVRKKCVELFL